MMKVRELETAKKTIKHSAVKVTRSIELKL